MSKKRMALIIFIVLLAAAVFALVRYMIFTKHYTTSDAVFIKSDTLTSLSFKLPGKIEKIYVKEGDFVKKGTLIAKLDTKELQTTAAQTDFAIKALAKNIEALRLQKEKLQNDITLGLKENANSFKKLQKETLSAEYEVNSMLPLLNKLQKDYEKFKKLFAKHQISEEKYRNIKSHYFSMQDKYKSAKTKLQILYLKQNDLKIAKKKLQNQYLEIKRLAKIIKASEDKLKSMKENLALIKEKINDSYLYMPFDGNIAKKFANTDEVVAAGQRVLSVVDLKNVYVLDLLDEKKLYGIQKGCRVKIHVDALDKTFDGYVSKILPASAATFALVPRDISSGEFTKLSQRFYVRMRFDKVPKGVKVGMSAEATIEKCKTGN